MIHKKLTYNDLGITLPEIYEQMGYGSSSDAETIANVGEDVKSEVNAILEEISTFLEPQLCFFITKGETSADSLLVQGRTLNIGHIIHRQLTGSSLFAFFVCTAGQAFQDYQERLKSEGDMMREYTANAIGSVIAEKTADCMERELEAFLASISQSQSQGQSQSHPLHHTNRFSPGYCGWHVREQQLLFSIFPLDHPCGVHLTNSSLMLPIKSVSGVIGIGENVKKLEYTCGLCNFAKCYKRRKKK